MSDRLDASPSRREGVTVPLIWVAVVLSLLVHLAALWQLLPRLHLLPSEISELSETSGPLVVHLAPMASPAPALPAKLAPPIKPRQLKAKRPRSSSSVIALKHPAPGIPAPPPVVIEPPRVPPSVSGDMASYIEARRRARGEPAAAVSDAGAPNPQPAEDDNARANRIAAANLGLQNQKTFGYDPSTGGGVFQVEHVGYDNAEFLFFGWDKDIRRKTKQLIEVRKGSNSDIRLAVIRKMIAIIREHSQQDFLWESQSLGRNITLSARLRDNAGLEYFMMNEFFPGQRLLQ